MNLPAAFLDRPLAHRGLHDPRDARLENCRAAFDAAVRAGYGIELDVQLTRDGSAVVFHDAALDRLAGRGGAIAEMTVAELSQVTLTGSGDRIETLRGILDGIPPDTPVLVEMKSNGTDPARLAAAVAHAVAGRKNVAVMSFDPACVIEMARRAPQTPRGLTTPSTDGAEIAGYEAAGACFVAHDRADLAHPDLARLRREGAAILSWTVRSTAEERAARIVADTVIFEDYVPIRPA